MNERITPDLIASVLSPETLVDRARTAATPDDRRLWCTRLVASSDARLELALMDAFEEDSVVTALRHDLRVELAVEGALATLDVE